MRSRRLLIANVVVAVAGTGCAVAGCAVARNEDEADAQTLDAAIIRALGDLVVLAPGETPRYDAAVFPTAPPAQPTAAPTGPVGPGTMATDGGAAPPTQAPTAPPTLPPPQEADAGQAPPPGTLPPAQEPDCEVDADCGAEDQLCFGGFCVVDPNAPQRVGNGACTNEADENVLRGNPRFRDVATACGLTCLGQMAPCMDTCVAMQTGFSPACSACYGAYIGCVGSVCIIPCVFNDDPVDCSECRRDVCDLTLGVCGGFAGPQQW